MEKIKLYRSAKFSTEAISKAIDLYSKVPDETKYHFSNDVQLDGEAWCHDDLTEFFSDYRKDECCEYSLHYQDQKYGLRVIGKGTGAAVYIKGPTRAFVQNVAEVFENYYASKSLLPFLPNTPIIFIGHGRSSQWRDLKDHLHDKHGYRIEAYETGARAGHVIRDILDDMASKASLALLVLTAEDEQADGTFHARQNVIHEVGLFQGKIGFNRAITLIEHGVEPFSNLQGIDQIRYSKGNIRETFGEVLATIKREFEGG